MTQDRAGRCLRNRKILQRFHRDEFHSAEFKVNGLPYLFQFKIWHTQTKEMFIIVKETSDILKRIKEGELFNMKYYNSISKYPITLKTKIDYITKEKDRRFRDHCLVGLKILPDQKISAKSHIRESRPKFANEINKK
jgi:hypothetical protein